MCFNQKAITKIGTYFLCFLLESVNLPKEVRLTLEVRLVGVGGGEVQILADFIPKMLGNL